MRTAKPLRDGQCCHISIIFASGGGEVEGKTKAPYTNLKWRQKGSLRCSTTDFISLTVLPEDGARRSKLKPPHYQLSVTAVRGVTVAARGGAVTTNVGRPQAKARGLRAETGVELRFQHLKRAPYIARPHGSTFVVL